MSSNNNNNNNTSGRGGDDDIFFFTFSSGEKKLISVYPPNTCNLFEMSTHVHKHNKNKGTFLKLTIGHKSTFTGTPSL